MAMADVDRAIGLARKAGGSFVGPRPDALIRKAEAALGLAFPPSYRKFICELGAGNIGPFEVYGLVQDNFQSGSIPNGIWLTLNERSESRLPAHLVLVASTGDGNYYAIDTDAILSDGDVEVVEWNPGASEMMSGPTGGFGRFFLRGVLEEIAS